VVHFSSFMLSFYRCTINVHAGFKRLETYQPTSWMLLETCLMQRKEKLGFGVLQLADSGGTLPLVPIPAARRGKASHAHSRQRNPVTLQNCS
jgi:hypothetical protein